VLAAKGVRSGCSSKPAAGSISFHDVKNIPLVFVKRGGHAGTDGRGQNHKRIWSCKDIIACGPYFFTAIQIVTALGWLFGVNGGSYLFREPGHFVQGLACRLD